MNLDDFLKDFLEEAFEKVEIIDDNLLDLENEPNNEEYLNEIFRAAHTVKGSAGTMGYENMSNLMHRIENIFTMLKEKKLTFSADINDVVLKGMDIVKEMLKNIEAKGEEDYDASDVIAQLDNINADDKKEKKKKPSTKKTSKKKTTKKTAKKDKETKKENVVEKTDTLVLTDIENDIIKQEKSKNNDIYHIKITFSSLSAMPSVGRFLIIREIENSAKIIKAQPDVDTLNEEQFIEEAVFIVAMSSDLEELKTRLNLPNEIENIEAKDYFAQSESAEEIEIKEEIEDVEEVEEVETETEKDEEEIHEETNEVSDKTLEQNKKTNNVNNGANNNLTKKETIQTLRVDSLKIDQLLNLIGEQVINTSRYFRMEGEFDKSLYEIKSLLNNASLVENIDSEFMKKMSALYTDFKRLTEEFKETDLMTRRLNNEMQQNTMKIRMLPIEKVFKRFPRMIRDISRELGKKIELQIVGQETELDKTVIELLGDPLVHIIRNALDHGIETSEERIKKGKPEEGKIELKAKHEGNYIYIEVIDDGKGLNRDVILKKAIDKGMIVEGMDTSLNDKEVFGLIFEPGFSTAEVVTGLSGRGVGMDVVKKSIEKVNGSVEIESKEGEGTCVRIKLPLTMAIIQALLVKGLDQVYSIPLNSVEETVKLKKEEIYSVKGNKTINIRNNVISVISIEELFHYPENSRDEYYIVILGYGDKQVGLIVDKLYGEQEIVIKNLDSEFVNTPGIAGANILGDGRVSLILDINKLIERVHT